MCNGACDCWVAQWWNDGVGGVPPDVGWNDVVDDRRITIGISMLRGVHKGGINMRDPQRINSVTDALNHLWHMCPDHRLYQLVYNVGYEPDGIPLYAIEDEEWLERIEAAIEQMKGPRKPSQDYTKAIEWLKSL
jgi:hypothetical protein